MFYPWQIAYTVLAESRGKYHTSQHHKIKSKTLKDFNDSFFTFTSATLRTDQHTHCSSVLCGRQRTKKHKISENTNTRRIQILKNRVHFEKFTFAAFVICLGCSLLCCNSAASLLPPAMVSARQLFEMPRLLISFSDAPLCAQNASWLYQFHLETNPSLWRSWKLLIRLFGLPLEVGWLGGLEAAWLVL